ncbi:MAG: hypothetical protein AAF968_09675 [Pseudomonadota bacterium]
MAWMALTLLALIAFVPGLLWALLGKSRWRVISTYYFVAAFLPVIAFLVETALILVFQFDGVCEGPLAPGEYACNAGEFLLGRIIGLLLLFFFAGAYIIPYVVIMIVLAFWARRRAIRAANEM